MDPNDVPVVDYARLKRLNADTEKVAATKRTPMTTVCMVVSFLGFMYLLKRYRDKQAREKSHVRGTLQESSTHLFS